MPNLNKHKVPRGRITAWVIGVGLLVAAIVFVPGACNDGDDDQGAKSPKTYPTTSEWTTYPTPLPTCEERGMVRDPEHSDTSWARSCATRADLDGRDAWRREHNDAALADANSELVRTVQNSSDQLVTLMNEFCASPMRTERPQRLVYASYPGWLLSHFDQAARLWRTYWFSNNLWTAPYNFEGAVSRICGESTDTYFPYSTPNSTAPNNIPLWMEDGYMSRDECVQHRSVRMC